MSGLSDYSQSIWLMIFTIVTIFFAAISIWAYNQNTRYEKEGIVTLGAVIRIEVELSWMNYGTFSYYPVVRFRTGDNKTYSVKMASTTKYTRGQLVDVVYLEGKPEKAIIKGSNAHGETWFVSALAAFIFFHVAAYQGYRMYSERKNL